MQPEGPPRQGLGGKRGDLLGRPFPLGDWGEPDARLAELHRWVEAGALRVADWYLADRGWKRCTAYVLRAGAGAGALTGAALPLLDLNGLLDGGAGWACLALLLAVACLAADRFFGLTSGWMRDVATAQAVHRRLEVFQFDWAAECVREVLGPTDGTAGEAAERRLTLLRRMTEDVSELVRHETAGWMVEFRSGAGPLYTQSLMAAWGSRPDAGIPAGRFPLPPVTRPNMPRQRPPEPPGW
ncbi:SLATT domain-containing protein [Streptomyces pactum]|uniref:SLATT domain-containing protein n=2 Tax=Streptomyces pactum TaxID=68249 RepID=A0ABS0NLX1_9ACTN|nr:SLATT domain-containing protein [Streptomyces pactum]